LFVSKVLLSKIISIHGELVKIAIANLFLAIVRLLKVIYSLVACLSRHWQH